MSDHPLPLEPIVLADVIASELDQAALTQQGLTGPHVQLRLTVAAPAALGGTPIACKHLLTAVSADYAEQLANGLLECVRDARAGVNEHPDLELPTGAGGIVVPGDPQAALDGLRRVEG